MSRVNKRKVGADRVWQTKLLRQTDLKRFFSFFFFFNIVWKRKIKCSLSFKITFAFITLHIYTRVFHIPSLYLAPPEYNIKVKGSCPYFCSYFISRKVTRVGCNFSFFRIPLALSLSLSLTTLRRISTLFPPSFLPRPGLRSGTYKFQFGEHGNQSCKFLFFRDRYFFIFLNAARSNIGSDRKGRIPITRVFTQRFNTTLRRLSLHR